jgi:segregation and condensation protein B
LQNPNDQFKEEAQAAQAPSSPAPASTASTDSAVSLPPEPEPGQETLVAETPQQANERKIRALSLLEAALYVAGKPLNINELGQVLNSRSKKRVEGYITTLMQEYQQHSRALEIVALKDERYVLQVKAEYTHLIKRLVNRPLLSSGPLKTLSYIAYRQPITQKRVIEVRGQHAYGHVKLLKDMGLIITERSGRSMALRTTDYFADYFGLTTDTVIMKKDLRKIFGEAIKEDAAERARAELDEEKQATQGVEEQPKGK